MKKSKTASAGKSRSNTKRPPARAAAFPNALAQLAPKGSTKAKKPRPSAGLFQ
jgi:hypothetical protein